MKRLLTDIDCCCCFIAFLSLIQAIPVKDNSEAEFGDTASNRTALQNVCVHENTIYAEGQHFSTSNPCETCVCDPPGVSCTLSSCDLKPGCKAIHRANRCCPEYVCECERNGKVYGNGEKVEEPNPCKVCYCKGGEIKCALVTCYTRDDCEPGYVAGVCCPKYDHCPPLEMMKNKSTTPAPALVIISDLKTESTVLKHRDVKKITPPDPTTNEPTASSTEEFTQTEETTTEIISSSMSTTEDAITTDIFDISSYTEMYDASEIFETTVLNVTDEWGANATTEYPTEQTTTDAASTEEAASDSTTEATTEQLRAEILEETTWVTTETTEATTYGDGITDGTTPSSVTEEYNTTEEGRTEVTTELGTETVPEIQDEKSDNPTTEAMTEEPTEEKPSVIKVIIPKNMKKELEVQVQKNLEGPAPIVVMISAEQIQFLKLAEEPPVYVQNSRADDQKGEHGHLGVVVVPKTTPTTVEMVKVVEGTVSSDVNTTTDKSVNISSTFDIIHER